jgi:hypothetical protein
MVVMTAPMYRAPIGASLQERDGLGADSVRSRTVNQRQGVSKLGRLVAPDKRF